MASERIEFHINAWREAMATEKWLLAAEHAEVLQTCGPLPSINIKAAVQVTPALEKLVTGYPKRALELLHGIKDKKTPLAVSALTIASMRVGDLDAAKKWCGRLVKLTRENTSSSAHRGGTAREEIVEQLRGPAFSLMARILLEKGNIAEAAFYQSKATPDEIEKHKWMKAALEVPNKEDANQQGVEEDVPEATRRPAPTDPVDTSEHRLQEANVQTRANADFYNSEKIEEMNNESVMLKRQLLEIQDQFGKLGNEFKEMKASCDSQKRKIELLERSGCQLKSQVDAIEKELPTNAPVLSHKAYNIHITQDPKYRRSEYTDECNFYETQIRSILTYLLDLFKLPLQRIDEDLLAFLMSDEFKDAGRVDMVFGPLRVKVANSDIVDLVDEASRQTLRTTS
ncbi:hypothetical protein AA313_de0205498 [Arthrobotrys entomopaga]|nr:hypothetical protein AA313_de0205498 [Arthrobotrys entomopaga]